MVPVKEGAVAVALRAARARDALSNVFLQPQSPDRDEQTKEELNESVVELIQRMEGRFVPRSVRKTRTNARLRPRERERDRDHVHAR